MCDWKKCHKKTQWKQRRIGRRDVAVCSVVFMNDTVSAQKAAKVLVIINSTVHTIWKQNERNSSWKSADRMEFCGNGAGEIKWTFYW